ncbi:hypothetical protein EI555_012672 [Monodon monoceros]|uniref:Uncharacterized protein n=1 Tax=Monodon monoceros TaxID=40151 RepID=A0A4U1EH33_MONMO|nr:hypothetical protein EI555_012672 [Monodon monoceros]
MCVGTYKPSPPPPTPPQKPDTQNPPRLLQSPERRAGAARNPGFHWGRD